MIAYLIEFCLIMLFTYIMVRFNLLLGIHFVH